MSSSTSISNKNVGINDDSSEVLNNISSSSTIDNVNGSNSLNDIIPSTPFIENSNVDESDKNLSKRPKRKIAIIFGYIGERYCGLQWNHLPDYPTVEEELLRALYRTDMISRENYEQEKVQQKLSWDRASRTDKGVHALRNVISVNVMLPYMKGSSTEFDTVEAKRLLMEVLPKDIIIYEIIIVTRSFNAYMMCGSRKYEYYIPTFAFMSHEEYCNRYFPPALAPSRPTLEEVGVLSDRMQCNLAPIDTSILPPGRKRQRDDIEEKEDNSESKEITLIKTSLIQNDKNENDEINNGKSNKDSVEKFHDGLFEKLLVFHTIPEDAMRDVAQYRLSSDKLEHARSIFHLFEGTHSFHNFTPGGKASDPSSMRFITSVTVSDPFIIDPADTTVLSTLQDWSPSRFYSPDDEGLPQFTTQEQKEDFDIEEVRRKMRDHMLSVYKNNNNENGGLEVVRIELHGQSFMFNQIRKMIGAVSSMCAAGLPPEHLRNHLLNKSIRCGTPMVPANGLFLSYLDFQRYNYRLERIQREGGNGRGRGGVYLDLVSEDLVAEFRRKIVAVVLRNEMVGDKMGRWMRSLRHVLRLACGIDLP